MKITKDIEAVQEIIDSQEELTIEDQQILINFLNENDENLEKKLESYVKVIRNFDSDVDSLKK